MTLSQNSGHFSLEFSLLKVGLILDIFHSKISANVSLALKPKEEVLCLSSVLNSCKALRID